jgi:hypothetical protein
MNDATLSIDSATPATLCEHCGKAFEPRSGNGGRPQKYCSEECRRKYKPQRGPTPPTPSPTRDIGATPVAAEKTRTGELARPTTGISYVIDDFKWEEDAVVLQEQRETAVYWNAAGNLVIRQRGETFDDDPFVVICQNNLHEFIDRLCDMAGIGGYRPD